MMSDSQIKRFNIDQPRFDQETYFGRAKHFFAVTNPLNIFKSTRELDYSRDVIQKYK